MGSRMPDDVFAEEVRDMDNYSSARHAVAQEAIRAREAERHAAADWRRVDSAFRALRAQLRDFERDRPGAAPTLLRDLRSVIDEALTITRSHLP